METKKRPVVLNKSHELSRFQMSVILVRECPLFRTSTRCRKTFNLYFKLRKKRPAEFLQLYLVSRSEYWLIIFQMILHAHTHIYNYCFVLFEFTASKLWHLSLKIEITSFGKPFTFASILSLILSTLVWYVIMLR